MPRVVDTKPSVINVAGPTANVVSGVTGGLSSATDYVGRILRGLPRVYYTIGLVSWVIVLVILGIYLINSREINKAAIGGAKVAAKAASVA